MKTPACEGGAGDGPVPSDAAAGREHCEHCFDALRAHFTGEPLRDPTFPQAYWWGGRRGGAKDRSVGLGGGDSMWQVALGAALGVARGGSSWVTLERLGRRGEGQRSLYDRRFSPIQWEEIPLLSCTVSLLRQFERANDWQDWHIGIHGLEVKFVDPIDRCQRSATFLPQIASEQGFSKQETIDHLIRKAGYTHQITEELRNSIELTRYQSTKADLTYEDYIQGGLKSQYYGLSNGYAHGFSNGDLPER
eukprot:evm.model.scf_202.7 EVM.evm.TU.scf_202.7   scf_202:65194-68918(+)